MGVLMAKFEQHCTDCHIILGKKYEEVNRWVDGLFWKYGTRPQAYRHNMHGVREAQKLFGPEGAKAAIVHIVRDIGKVPHERDYDRVPEGIDIMPTFTNPPLGFEQHFDLFKVSAEEEIERLLGE